MKKERYYSLDILKFILALIIVCHHFQQVMEVHFQGLNFYGGRIDFGNVVEFFFIISGFVAAIHLNKISEMPFYEYMKKRALRLYPMVIISVLSYTALIILYRAYSGNWYVNKPAGIWRIITSLSLTFSGGVVTTVGLGINNPIWYLCVLLLCYILFWVVLKVCKAKEVSHVIGSIIIMIIGAAAHYYEFNLPFLNIASSRGYTAFFLGTILFSIYTSYKDNKKLYIISIIIIAICTVLMLFDFSTYDDPWSINVFVIFPCTLFCFLWINSFLHNSVWTYFGKISFEIYLWHAIILAIFKMYIDESGRSYLITRSSMIAICFVVIIIATFMYFLVESCISKRIIYLKQKEEK